MYNLLVTHKKNAWEGAAYSMDMSRCVRESEYSDPSLAERFGALTEEDLGELVKLPCIFAYEGRGYMTPDAEPPRFGFIRKVDLIGTEYRIQYQIRDTKGFLTAQQLFDSAEELGIELESFEMTRTHWAVKDVDLPAALRPLGIVVPPSKSPPADITSHTFDVALSFPGEARDLVEPIAKELASVLGRNAVFYDNNFVSQLARPNLDTLLQGIYRTRSKLVVVFLSGHYQGKEWCGVEFRAIKEIIKAREDKVMFVRTDDGSVDGVFSHDGYIDARRHSPKAVAEFIRDRVDLLHHAEQSSP